MSKKGKGPEDGSDAPGYIVGLLIFSLILVLIVRKAMQ